MRRRRRLWGRGVDGTCLLCVWVVGRVRRSQRKGRWGRTIDERGAGCRLIGSLARTGLVGGCRRLGWGLSFDETGMDCGRCGLREDRGFDIDCRSRRFPGLDLRGKGGYMR